MALKLQPSLKKEEKVSYNPGNASFTGSWKQHKS